MKEKNQVILVDEKDNLIGIEEKLKAHIEGKRHRAFSVFIFNSQRKFLLQKRAAHKYHSPGLWSNTCCSHPQSPENIKEQAERRLQEEMGIKSSLREIFTFSYRVKLGSLVENEIDHIFIGFSDQKPKPNPQEVEDFKWLSKEDLEKEIQKHPEQYTFWFKKIYKKVYQYLEI